MKSLEWVMAIKVKCYNRTGLIFISVVIFLAVLFVSYHRISSSREGPLPIHGIDWDIRERRRLMEEFCVAKRRVVGGDGQLSMEHAIKYYVDDRHKFIYCHMPKVATTTWLKLLLPHNDHVGKDIHNVSHFKSLRAYTKQEQSSRLRSYFKFLFVRHPFERFVSAYKDKIRNPREAVKYLKSYLPNLPENLKQITVRTSEEQSRKIPTISLADFVDVYISQTNLSRGMFSTTSTVCQPCEFKYDFIGHYETLARDAEYVLEKISLSHKIKFPKRTLSRTTNEVTYYFRQLSRKQQILVEEKLKDDYAMFGYKPMDVEQNGLWDEY